MSEGNDKIGHPKKAAMLKALEESLGIVTTACAKVDISRNTHYLWLKDDPIYAEAVRDLEEVVLDFGESALHELVKQLNPAGVIFMLKTKGKRRGYIERTEIDVSPFADKSDKELDEFIKSKLNNPIKTGEGDTSPSDIGAGTEEADMDPVS